MTRDQLLLNLAELGVYPSSYSLSGLKNNDCVCVVEDGDKCRVYYVERDKPTELALLDSVDAAYDFVYETFKKWLNK